MNIDADECMEWLEDDAKEREQQVDKDQHSLACLSTFERSQLLYYLYVSGQLNSLNQNSQDLKREMGRLSEIVRLQGQQYDQCVTAVAACQKQTAKILNNEVERYIIKPAIETVVALSEELFRLNEVIKQLCQRAELCSGLEELQQEAEVSRLIACEKMAYFYIERIAPAKGDDFDANMHAVCGHVDTTDSRLHGKIKEFITSGIVYHSKVLRQAKVSLFRHIDIKEQTAIERNENE